MHVAKSYGPRRCRLGSFLAALVLCVATAPAGAARTVACGEVYAGSGELEADCEGDIRIDGGSLDLSGHTVHGSVRCEGLECEVYSDGSRGTISGIGGEGSVGIDAAGARLTVRNVLVTGFGTGIRADEVLASDVEVAGNAGFGINALHGIELVDSSVGMNGNDGLHSQIGQIRVSGSQLTGNRGNGVRALKGVIMDGSSVSWSGGDGVRNFSGAVVVSGSTVSSNGNDGVRTDDSDCFPSGTLELRSSTIEGNASNPDCGEGRVCADVVACNLTQVGGSSRCETSYRLQSGLPGESWRVCQLD
jgi:hypothetical protein